MIASATFLCERAVSARRAPGRGTTFHIYSPAVERAVEEFAEAHAALRWGRGSILFVDDEEDITAIRQQVLESLGYEVAGMTSSVDALRFFSVQPDRFDLVITAHIMPHLSGIDLARGIRRIRRDTPVILCTANGEAIMKESARELGIRAFLMKPYSTREIVDAIGSVLSVS